jgi:predicted glycoside hydrolase/deacetylase ChbG (UPF0249 family)
VAKFRHQLARDPSHIDGHNHVQVFAVVCGPVLTMAATQRWPIRWPCACSFDQGALNPYLTLVQRELEVSEQNVCWQRRLPNVCVETQTGPCTPI